jgi:hypothetical protein|nr:MAG TPA: hypothetical protein [Caudoviricetes sp.]
MKPVEHLQRFQAEYRGLANNRQAFDTKRASDPAFAAEIESLYGYFIGTFRRYCGNCWHDAFIQLLTLKNMDNKSQFKVRSGTLLHDPVNQDVRYMLTPRRLAQMGDELALRHLAHNPNAINYFEKPLPADLDKMIEEYRAREEESAPAEMPKEGSTTSAVAAKKIPKKKVSKATERKGTPRTKAQGADKAEEASAKVEEESAPAEMPKEADAPVKE